MNNKHLIEVIKDNTKRFTTKEALFYKDGTSKKWVGISWNNFFEQTSLKS